MILVENNFDNLICESKDDGKKLYLTGPFMQAEDQNGNGRRYPRSLIAESVDFVNNRAASERHVLGELDHPQSLIVKLENVSHRLVEMRMEGNTAYGKAEILEEMPKGAIAKALIKAGINIGVSSRGGGDVNESTGLVEHYRFVTVDLVASPSASNAYPTSIYEQLESYERGIMVEGLADAIKHDAGAQKYFEREILRFIKRMDYSKK